MEKISFEKLTINEVEALSETVKPFLASLSEDLVLDLSDVRKMDMSAIQLFLATQKSCKAQNYDLRLEGLDESLQKDINLCGCSRLLGTSHE